MATAGRNRRLVTNRTGFGGHRDCVLLESTASISGPPEKANGKNAVTLVRNTETEMELIVETTGGVLVVADRYDQDWHTFLVNEDGSQVPLKTWRADLNLRGIPLVDTNNQPLEGRLRIRMVYRPRWVIRGAWISCVTMALCLVLAGFLFVRRRRQR